VVDETVLGRARASIDSIDDQLLALLNQRADLAHQVALGKKSQTSGEVIYYRPEREAEVLRRLCESNSGPFSDETIAAVFREVISATLALEQSLVIGVSAMPASAAPLAALTHFGRAAQIKKFSSMVSALRSVGHDCDLTLIAIDDAHSALFPDQLEQVFESDLLPVAEIVVEGGYGVMVTGNPSAEQAVEVIAGVDVGGYGDLLSKQISDERYWHLLSHTEGNHRLLVNVDRNFAGWRLDQEYLHINLPVATRFLVLGRQRCQRTGQDRTLVCADGCEALMDLAVSERQAGRSARVTPVGAGAGRCALVLEGHCDDESVQVLIEGALLRDSSVAVTGSWPVVDHRLFSA